MRFGPVACWRIDPHRFDFDTSFPRITASQDFARLAAKRPPGPPPDPNAPPPAPVVHTVQSGEWLDGIAKANGLSSWQDLYYAPENASFRASHPDPNKIYPGDQIVIPNQTTTDKDPPPQEDPNGYRLVLFGHSDPTGQDDYNKVLAGRRAMIIYGALVRDVNLWEQVFSPPYGGDSWTFSFNQIMLAAVGYDPGAIDGMCRTADIASAVTAFQNAKGIHPATGYIDTTTRKALFRAYMDVLCATGTDKDGKQTTLRYNRADFLSHGQGPDGKQDYQSCGEFNPLIVFSQDETTTYADPANKTARDTDNTPNRRVTIYMFRPKTWFPYKRWPCPTVKEGISGCKAQFWIDGEKRRNPQTKRRDSRKNGKTMACKWYSRIMWRGACEGRPQKCRFRLWLHDRDRERMPGTPFRITDGTKTTEGFANSAGAAELVEVPKGVSYTVQWGELPWSKDDSLPRMYQYWREVYVNTRVKDEEHTDRELSNLCYAELTSDERTASFRANYPAVASTDPIELVHDTGKPTQGESHG